MEFIKHIEDLIVAQFGPLGPVYLLGATGILMVLLVLPALALRERDPFERLRMRGAKQEDHPQAQLRGQSANKNLEKFSTFLEPQNAEEYSAIRTKLMQAGYRSKDSVMIYHLAQMLLGLGFLGAGFAYAMATKGNADLSMQSMILKIMGPGAAGYFLPKYWITRRQAVRQEEISLGFPDSLDMLLVCVEAGQSLDQAIIRVAEELQSGFPALAQEYATVSLELKAGKDKTSVLRDFGERAANDDISAFVTVLIQSQTYGTSIADALRVYAAEMRDKRVMRAEEKANKLPTKLTLTTMMLTVPPLLIILMAPSVLDISKAFHGG